MKFACLTKKTRSSKNMSFVALLVFTVLFLLKGILKEYMRIKCEIVTSTVRVI